MVKRVALDRIAPFVMLADSELTIRCFHCERLFRFAYGLDDFAVCSRCLRKLNN